MFWFDYGKMLKLVSITFKLKRKTQNHIRDLFKTNTNIELSFTEFDIYLIGNSNLEVFYLNILHDVCYDLFDIDSKINSAINDDLIYNNRVVYNNTGSFAITELVVIDGKTLVRKTPKSECPSLDEEYRFMNELYLENNDYFVKTFQDEYIGSYLMELANDTLFSYIKSNININDNERAFIVKTILDEVDYIHKQRIIHNDLHPENILLFRDENGNKWKLSDFGLAYNLLERKFVIKDLKDKSRKSEFINYRSKSHTVKNDFYSIGRLINFIYTKTACSLNHKFSTISKKCQHGYYSDVSDIKRDFNLLVDKVNVD